MVLTARTGIDIDIPVYILCLHDMVHDRSKAPKTSIAMLQMDRISTRRGIGYESRIRRSLEMPKRNRRDWSTCIR